MENFSTELKVTFERNAADEIVDTSIDLGKTIAIKPVDRFGQAVLDVSESEVDVVLITKKQIDNLRQQNKTSVL